LQGSCERTVSRILPFACLCPKLFAFFAQAPAQLALGPAQFPRPKSVGAPREPLEFAPAVARHPLPAVAPEREVVDARPGLQPRDLDVGVERRRDKRVLGRVEPAHADSKCALRRVPVGKREFGSIGVPRMFGKTGVVGSTRNGWSTRSSRTVSGKSCTGRRPSSARRTSRGGASGAPRRSRTRDPYRTTATRRPPTGACLTRTAGAGRQQQVQVDVIGGVRSEDVAGAPRSVGARKVHGS